MTGPARKDYPVELRRVIAWVEVDGELREMGFLTNHLTWSAQTIADLYRCRWEIEVFFKQIKQTLQLADFLGNSANAVQWQVWTALRTYLLLRFCAWLSQWAHSFTRNLAEKTTLLEAHQREIQKVRDEMTRTHKLYIQEQITAQGFGDFYKPAEVRLNQLLVELPKLEAEVDFVKVNKLSADDIVHESATLQERWPSLPPGDKRKIVEALIEKIVIGDGEIDITYSCMPSSEERCKNQRELGNR